MKEKTIVETLQGRGKTFAVSLKALFRILGATTTESKKAVNNIILDLIKVELEQAGVTGIRTLTTDSSRANYIVLDGDLLTIHLTSLPTGESKLKMSARFGTETKSIYTIRLLVKDGATGIDSTETLEFGVSELLSEVSATDIADLKSRVGGLEVNMTRVNQILDEAGESLYAYGVMHKVDESSPDLIRIGNMDMHRTLPVQSRMRRCLVLDNGTVNYYLDENDSTKKEDGEAADLTGADGQFMVEIPEHYRKCTFDEDAKTMSVMVSLIPFYGAIKRPLSYISAVGATVERSTNKLASVVNFTAEYRGGNNTSAWDNEECTLLGRRATSINLTNFRTYARNRGSNWGCADYSIYMDVVWLLVIEYATLNSQKAYNATLDANGFRQGCLGDGVTNLTDGAWSAWNSYNPFVPNDITNSLGNLTGVKTYTMPFGYDAKKAATTKSYVGEWNATTAYTNTDCVSVDEDLYSCILPEGQGSAGDNPTSSPSVWSKLTRTTTSVHSYRGVMNIFGEVFNITDGYLQMWDAENSQFDTYICRDHSKYASSVTEDYALVGHNATSSGHAKKSKVNAYGDFLPSEVGGSASTYFSDYYYQAQTEGTVYALFAGGHAHYGSLAGVFCFALTDSVSHAHAHCGSRLCCFGAAE